jgi:hypothetical protein
VVNIVNQQKYLEKRRSKFWNKSKALDRLGFDCLKKKCWCILKKVIPASSSRWRLEVDWDLEAQPINFKKSIINKLKQF